MLSLATFSLAATENTTAHDLFIPSDKSLSLTLNVANDSEDIFFSFTGPDTSSWISFGLGSDRMDSAIMFMVYASSSGNNITLSPRLPTNHAEPAYSADIDVELLEGSGIANMALTANFRCSNCRGINAAKIGNYNLNTTSTNQKMSFASGPLATLKSNDLNAATNIHRNYGSFTMDMVRATGPGGVAIVPLNATLDVGATQLTYKTYSDYAALAHAGIMIFTYLGLMPFGVIVLRVFGLVKWHGINQGAAALLALIGTGLGFYIGAMYNRSKRFNNAHQIIGLVLFLAVIAQFVLGFLHHRTYKKTQFTTKMAPIHVWMGRAIFPVAVVVAFL